MFGPDQDPSTDLGISSRREDRPIPARRKSVKPDMHTKAVAMRAEAMRDKKCNTLGLREECLIVDGKPNEMLSQVLRVAKTNSSSLCSPGSIAWGVKCECAGDQHHLPNCWKNVEKIYWFLQQKFMHQFIHQMWLEGASN